MKRIFVCSVQKEFEKGCLILRALDADVVGGLTAAKMVKYTAKV